MADQLFEMTWVVATDGYRWIDAVLPKIGKHPVLTTGIPLGQEFEWKTYPPLKRYPDLFLRFAKLSPKRKAIQVFANTYGLLGIMEPIPVKISAKERLVGSGDPFYEWHDEILRMRAAIKIWTDLKTAGEAEDWTDRQKDLQKNLQKLINARLEKWCSARLLLRKEDQLDFYVVPQTLIGAFWLQLARAVTKHKDYRPCLACRSMIEISLDQTGKREDTLYCSPACRQRDHRLRKEGKSLYRNGMTMPQIGKRLSRDVAIIKKWSQRWRRKKRRR